MSASLSRFRFVPARLVAATEESADDEPVDADIAAADAAAFAISRPVGVHLRRA